MTVQRFVSADRSKWLLKILVEVAFISIGVFLALMGEQWRERAHARELARGTLQRFRVEIVRNRKSIDAVKDYHKSVLASLQHYMDADAAQRDRQQVRVRGLHPPANRSRTAQSLTAAHSFFVTAPNGKSSRRDWMPHSSSCFRDLHGRTRAGMRTWNGTQ